MPNPKLLDDHQFDSFPTIARWQLLLWSVGQAVLGLVLSYLSLWVLLYLNEWTGWLDRLGSDDAGPFIFIQIGILILPALNYWAFIPFLILQKSYYPAVWKVMKPELTWMLSDIYKDMKAENPKQHTMMIIIFWYSIISGLAAPIAVLVFMEIGWASNFSSVILNNLPNFVLEASIITAIIDLYWMLFIIWGLWWYFRQWLPAWKSYSDKQGSN